MLFSSSPCTTHHHYLHSAFSFSGSDERIKPCVHFGHRSVLAWVPNSSLLEHRLQVHQKNFPSCRCCRLFNVPCDGDEKINFTISNKKWIVCKPAGCKRSSGLWFRLFSALLLCVQRAHVFLDRPCDLCSAHNRDTSKKLPEKEHEWNCLRDHHQPQNSSSLISRTFDEFPPHWILIVSNHFEFDSQSHSDYDSTMPECLYL